MAIYKYFDNKNSSQYSSQVQFEEWVKWRVLQNIFNFIALKITFRFEINTTQLKKARTANTLHVDSDFFRNLDFWKM